MIGTEDTDKRPIRTMEKPVPINTVRLVVPLTDEATGVTRDVIVKKVASTKPWFDRVTNHKRWTRIIPGLNIKIPWPKTEPRVEEDQSDDTLRIDVEAKTFLPYLLTPPIPGGVIDELRNKYSAFRTRHDPEYIAAKMEEDRLKEEKKKESEKMRTPLKEINRRERKLRKAKGKATLTPEMMENIGKLIAQKRQSTLAAVGVSEEVPKEIAAPEPVAA
jgi:large subunit ribosomal protein L24